MFRNTFLILIGAAAIFGSACQSVEKTTGATVEKTDQAMSNKQANIPPEFSGKITNQSMIGNVNPNTNSTDVPKGTTPTPGIPSEEELIKRQNASPKKTPPIPGFPSEEELRKQMNTPISSARIMESKPPTVLSNSNAITPVKKSRKVRRP